jgi:hypothetical protein
MAVWQFVMGPASGGHDVSVTQARSRSVTFRLSDPHEAGFDIDANTPAGMYVQELSTDLHCIRDGQILYRGRVGPTADDGDEKSADTVNVKTSDYRELLKRRRLYSGDIITFTQNGQDNIAWVLVNNTQVRAGGDLGISKGVGFGGDNQWYRDRTYILGDSIGEKIQELSEVDQGFEWSIDPVDASSLHMNLYHPRRGTNKGVVLEYGGLIRAYHRETNPGDYANQIRVTGDTSVLTAAGVTRVAADIATRPEGIWDGIYGNDIQTSAALNDRADWQLANSQLIPVSYSLTFKPGGWDGPDHVWLGDTVEVVIKSGRLNVDAFYRVHEIAITLDDNGNESVVMSLNGPNPDYRYRPATTLRRLTNLERR